ncbi:MAG: hypothetical protein LBF33_01265 [Oscillospiraceae bacterium]|jgi:hypothetical protein|nr:hypothetical protein [Oscillospiraceae bacterium]
MVKKCKLAGNLYDEMKVAGRAAACCDGVNKPLLPLLVYASFPFLFLVLVLFISVLVVHLVLLLEQHLLYLTFVSAE